MPKTGRMIWVKTALVFCIVAFLAVLSVVSLAITTDSVSGATGSWSSYKASSLNVSGNEIRIYTEQELALFAYNVNNSSVYSSSYTVKLMSCLDLSAHYWVPIGSASHPMMAKFEGNNCTITGMTITTDCDYCALIGYTTSSISNLNLSDFTIKNTGTNCVAGICGYTTNKIYNCQAQGKISCAPTAINRYGTDSAKIAGICGMSTTTLSPAFEKCNSMVNITASTTKTNTYCKVSGICSYVTAKTTIKSCINQGDISSTGSSTCADVCGIVYAYGEITFENCENKGAITSSNFAAGISVYSPDVTFTSCSNFGKINGTKCAAGITLQAKSVTNCYNGGSVTSQSHACGILANYGGQIATISNCINAGKVTATDSAGVACGICYTEDKISYCSNSGAISAGGTACGIIYEADGVTYCSNYGDISQYGDGSYSDFVASGIICLNKTEGNNARVIVNYCVNSGSVYGNQYTSGILSGAINCEGMVE